MNAVERSYDTNQISSSQFFLTHPIWYPLANTEDADETETNEEVPEGELVEENATEDDAESAESPPEDDPADPPVEDGAE